ncbi:MAG TPA: pyridoxamine 5'-phosphate oxidase family protein [Verrucomicrobiae bacterium]|nr:pyridoxamine 5'-phosphate oxidase family protein [Verrucomicrobiae bacterium]
MNAQDINRARVMQLATSRGGQPWICNVYFIVTGGNFYWLSFPDRRHSKELADNAKAAVAIALQEEVPVVGVQAEGTVRVVQNLSEAARVLALYVHKYGKGKDFIELLKRGKNRHELYCLMPESVMVFDERSPSDAPYRQIQLANEE